MKSINMKLFTFILAFTIFGALSAQKSNFLRATFSSGSIDKTQLTATIGEPIAFSSNRNTQGSLSIGAQPGDAKTKVGLYDKLEIFEEVEIYPNPTNANLNINIKKLTLDNFLFNLNDLSGKLIMSSKIGSGNNIIDLSQLLNGTYIISIIDSSQRKRKSISILKQ